MYCRNVDGWCECSVSGIWVESLMVCVKTQRINKTLVLWERVWMVSSVDAVGNGVESVDNVTGMDIVEDALRYYVNLR